MRTVLFLLLLVVFFLAGALYGTGFQKTEVEKPLEEPVSAEMEINKVETIDKQSEAIPVQTENTSAYKAASALESIVNFFYNMIVDILYQVSKLFF